MNFQWFPTICSFGWTWDFIQITLMVFYTRSDIEFQLCDVIKHASM